MSTVFTDKLNRKIDLPIISWTVVRAEDADGKKIHVLKEAQCFAKLQRSLFKEFPRIYINVFSDENNELPDDVRNSIRRNFQYIDNAITTEHVAEWIEDENCAGIHLIEQTVQQVVRLAYHLHDGDELKLTEFLREQLCHLGILVIDRSSAFFGDDAKHRNMMSTTRGSKFVPNRRRRSVMEALIKKEDLERRGIKFSDWKDEIFEDDGPTISEQIVPQSTVVFDDLCGEEFVRTVDVANIIISHPDNWEEHLATEINKYFCIDVRRELDLGIEELQRKKLQATLAKQAEDKKEKQRAANKKKPVTVSEKLAEDGLEQLGNFTKTQRDEFKTRVKQRHGVELETYLVKPGVVSGRGYLALPKKITPQQRKSIKLMAKAYCRKLELDKAKREETKAIKERIAAKSVDKSSVNVAEHPTVKNKKTENKKTETVKKKVKKGAIAVDPPQVAIDDDVESGGVDLSELIALSVNSNDGSMLQSLSPTGKQKVRDFCGSIIQRACDGQIDFANKETAERALHLLDFEG